MKYIIAFFAFCCFSLCGYAQHTVFVEDSLETVIYFHVSKVDVDMEYMDNAKRLQEFFTRFNDIRADKKYRISSFEVYSNASPEGYHGHNIQLSQNRAVALINYIEQYISLADISVNIHSVGSDWQGLRRLVAESNMEYKDEVLAIIDSESKIVQVDGIHGRDADSRLLALKELHDGVPYNYISTFFFPVLRSADVKLLCKFEREVPDTVPALTDAEEPIAEPIDTLPVDEIVEDVEWDKLPLYRIMMSDREKYFKRYKLILALRSNLLLPAMNIGFEVPLGNRWSVGVDHYYPWLWRYWPTHSNKYCYELMFETLEFRYWFGDGHRRGEANFKNRLLGHSISIFGAGGYYDFEKNWMGYQGELWAGGIDYLYAKPIWKGKMHLEFELGVGFLYSSAREYDVFEDGGLLFRRKGVTKKTNYIGPLRASISIVVPIYRRYGKKIIVKE